MGRVLAVRYGYSYYLQRIRSVDGEEQTILSTLVLRTGASVADNVIFRATKKRRARVLPAFPRARPRIVLPDSVLREFARFQTYRGKSLLCIVHSCRSTAEN